MITWEINFEGGLKVLKGYYEGNQVFSLMDNCSGKFMLKGMGKYCLYCSIQPNIDIAKSVAERVIYKYAQKIEFHFSKQNETS